MVATRRAWSWSAVAVLVAALPLALLAPPINPGAGSWWPSGGLAAAALLLAPRRFTWPLAAVMVLVTLPVLVTLYEFSLLGALVAPSVYVLPALLVATLLRPAPGDVERTGAVADFGGRRYHSVSVLAALLAGALTVAFSFGPLGAVEAVRWGAVGVVGGLAELLLVLPLVASTSGPPATGSRAERWTQRVLLLATTVLLQTTPVTPALAVFVFPLAGWAALRSTRREAHLQVGAVGIAFYLGFVLNTGTVSLELGAVLPTTLEALPVYLFAAALSLLTVPLALAVELLSQARAAAVRNEQTVERLLDGAASTLLVATDPEGRIVRFNEGASQLLGYTAEEVSGRLPSLFHTDAEIARHADELGVPPDLGHVVRRQMALGRRRDWEFVRADGTHRMMSVDFNVVHDSDGTVSLVVTSGEDVTDRLQTQHALEAALDREQQSVLRLQEVDQVKDELVSNVSHELRTPITSIAGYVELLGDGSLGELTRPQRDALERVERNANRLESLVDDLLTMSRAQSGSMQLTRSRVDLGEVVRAAWELFDDQLRHRALVTSLVLPPRPVPVLGDPRALERVVVNLVANAVKFTADGGEVTLALTQASDGAARVMVRDTGMGISPEDQEKLFTRFFRSRQVTDRAIQGSGLGLSIVQTLVAQHGGEVSVRSRPGVGTRVLVELPPA